MLPFKSILLKLSGEGLAGSNNSAFQLSTIHSLISEIKELQKLNITLALVVGGGNIFRGKEFKEFGLNQTTADSMGMLATIFNALALSDIFNNNGLAAEVYSSIEMNKLTKFYNVQAAKEALKSKVIILAGGIANPFFTTDTAAVVRASELGCEAVFKATQVNGVFAEDPKKNPNAKKLNKLTFNEVINNNLKVMDLQSIIIAKEQNLPIYIFNMHNKNAIINVINEQSEFSVISN